MFHPDHIVISGNHEGWTLNGLQIGERDIGLLHQQLHQFPGGFAEEVVFVLHGVFIHRLYKFGYILVDAAVESGTRLAPVKAIFFTFLGCRMASSRLLIPPSLHPITLAESIPIAVSNAS